MRKSQPKWVRRKALTPSRVMVLRRKAIQARWINPSAGTPQPATRRHHQTSELTEVLWGPSASVGAFFLATKVLKFALKSERQAWEYDGMRMLTIVLAAAVL